MIARTPFLAFLLLAAAPAFAASIHVSATTGDDAADGSSAHPLKTINAAARKAMPGDTVTVHEGVYREWVKPPRGGTSDKNRITYEAAPGEKVTITGSEAPKGWEKVSGDTWKLTLPNAFFREGNPFDELIYGTWYDCRGHASHTGSVFLDGKRLTEAFSRDAVLKAAGAKPLWYAEADGNGGPMLMYFDWLRPVGGKLTNCTQASVENADQTLYGSWAAGYLKDGSVIHFEDVDFGAGTDTVEFNAGSLAKEASIEFHLGKADGELLGTGRVTSTGNWEKFVTFKATLSRKLSGRQSIHLVFRAPAAKPDGKTTIWAQFPGVDDPNSGRAEIASRPAVFFPETTGRNYVTVRGFTLRNAATNWASPSAFQPGLIGPRWAKGWVIENNDILNSRCSGISLGRPTFGHSHHYQQNKYKIHPESNGGQTEAQLRDYFDNASWNKDEAGHHVVRDNRIWHCGQTGIVGCSGGAFSVIERNDILDICVDEPFAGCEQAGIKLHFPVDTIIRDNRIGHTLRGIWLDWGTQGAQVTDNLFHDNGAPGPAENDLFIEVCHGPILVANNLFLSARGPDFQSQGIAMAHNLLAGSFRAAGDGRATYVYKPHDTVSVGKPGNPAGDLRWYNNIAAEGTGMIPGGLPSVVSGNALFPAGANDRWLFNILSFKPDGGPAVTAMKNDGGSGTASESCAEGAYVSSIRPGDNLRFDAADFGSGSRSVEIRASADSGYGGRVEFRADSPSGELLGACDIPATGGWRKWENFRADLKPVSGKKKIFLVFVREDASAARAPRDDDSTLKLAGVAAPKFEERADGVYLLFTEDAAWRTARRRKLVTTELLGNAVIPKQGFTNPDDSPVAIDTDYFGKKRDRSNPFPGPFETPVTGEVKVWPKNGSRF